MSALTSDQLAAVDAYLDAQQAAPADAAPGVPLITQRIAATAKNIMAALSDAGAIDSSTALCTDAAAANPADDSADSSWWGFAAAAEAASVPDEGWGISNEALRLTALAWLQRLGLVLAESLPETSASASLGADGSVVVRQAQPRSGARLNMTQILAVHAAFGSVSGGR